MAIRPLNSTLRDSLLTEEPFVYAHLVKFEKPLKTESGKSARREQDYVYISDGSFDVLFDDGSSDVEGNTNGSQIYTANKLISVGAVSETIEARATSMNIQVSAAALSTTITDSYAITSSSITGSEDLVAAGFREGDTVVFSSSGSNNGKTVRIDEFQNDNKKAIVTPQDTTLSTSSGEILTLTFKSPEVEAILSDRSTNSYARYINRDVFIYKAHINTETGAIIGEPYLLFKGIIASGKLTEDPSKSSIISWGLTSHWGDFSRVQGRLTSDPYHRAIDENGIPDPEAAIRRAYTRDLGFLHSEQAVNLVSIYSVKETKYDMKKKSSWLGLKTSYKMIEYQVDVDREVDLRFNLEAKYLPVVYGVNKIDSIPVFVDTLNTDSKKVFVAYALCEGQIAGLYDIYFDDTSSICIDENDSDTRSTQTAENTIDVLCQGRADRGDTLTPQNIATQSAVTAFGSGFAEGIDSWSTASEREAYYDEYNYFPPIDLSSTPGGASQQSAGITHEKGTRFTTPIDARLQFHAGKSNQIADSILLSNSSNFKIATDYYSGTDPYWGANHRLLDTAYVVAEYTIGEGETTIPSLNFVVRGKGIDCFNYDYAYVQDPAYTSTDSNVSSFNIGESITVKNTETSSTITTATIADIFNLTNIDGAVETRIRFTSDPTGGSATAFFIDNGTDQYHMVTYDHVATSGTVPSELKTQITTVVANSGGSGVDITPDNPSDSVTAALTQGQIFAILQSGALPDSFDPRLLNEFLSSISAGVVQNVGQTTTESSSLVSQYIVVTDGIQLASSASSTTGAYIGYEIELTSINPDDGSIRVQKRIITAYDGTQKVATVSEAWEFPPKVSYTYKIYPTTDDVRVSTNPALQLLDYLRSKRYGRDLDINEDLNQASFLEAARACDTRSNVFMLTTSAATVGDVYKYATTGGKTLWQGTVKSSSSIGSLGYVVEFEDVLGKLVNRWEDWKYFYTGELYYKDGVLHEASSNGTISYSAGSNVKASLSLARVDGTGPSSLTLDISDTRKTLDGDPVVKTVSSTGAATSGYSLYDSDDVKYWRYLGWEAQNQRHVTRHQTNAVVDTSRPIFDNINSMLNHFNGILRYSAGKYSLAIKTAAGTPTSVTVNGETYIVERIEEEDIIGSINVEDAGQKGTYNQVDVSINDPQNRFEGRSVMMFDSKYLKEDRMVPKKGSVRSPYVTNYYNARINAKQYLEDSRAGLKVNFTMAPRGVLLQAGDIIEINYPRFGWVNKQYRITNLNLNQNCLIQVTAEEHTDEAYLIAAQSRPGIGSVEGVGANQAALSPPTGLSATTDKFGGIQLSWTNSANFKPASYSTQIWSSDDNDRANATLLDTTKASSYIDSIVEGGSNTKYYWVRHVALVPPQTGTQTGLKEIFSVYEPSSETAGVQGTSGDIRAQRVDLTLTQGVISYDINGANPDISSITITAESQGFTDPYFKFTGGGSAFTDETEWTDGSFGTRDTATFSVPTSYAAAPYTITVEVKEGGTGDVLATDVTSIASIKPGGDGIDALTVYLDNPVHSVNASNTGVVSDFGSAGTTISVYEGTTQLDYDGAGTTDGHWTVTAAGTNITPDSITESGDNAVLGDGPSNMTADNAKIVLSISGKRLDGSAFSVEAQQSISKARNGTNGSDAKTVSLRASEYTISYAADGSTPDVSTITLTADSFNFDDAYFQFTGGGSAFTDETLFTDGSSQNQDTVTFTVPNTYSSTPYNFTVEVKEGGTGVVVATDTLTIASLKPGTNGDDGVDALTLILTNPAHTIPVGTDGNLSYTGSGTAIQLFEGVTALDYDGVGTTDGHWTVSTSGSNITPGNISDSGNNAVATVASNMTDDVASITYTITGKRADGNAINLTAVQSFAKANRGASGTDSKVVTLRASEQVIAYNAAGGSPSPSGNITLTAESQNFTDAYFKFTGGGTAFTDESSWTNGTTANSDTATFAVPSSYSATPYNFVVEVKEGSTGDVIATDTLTIASVKPGTNGDPGDDGLSALTAILSNEAHAIPENISGTLTFTGSGTSIRLFEGATELDYDGVGTTNGHWTVSVSDTNVTSAASPFTENGNQVDVSAITALSGNSGSRTFTLTGKRADGTAISLSKIQSFVRTVDGPKGDPGNDGVDGVGISGSATHVTFNKDGSTYDPTTTSTVSLSAVGGTITSVTYTASSPTYMTISGAGNSGCTVTFSNNRSSAQVNASNSVTAAVIGTTSDGTTGVSFGSYVIPIGTSINGADGGAGADGLRTVQGYLYYEKTTAGAPSAPSGNTYTFSTGLVSGTGIGTGVNTWTNSPRTQDPTSSNTHYIVRYYGIESAANSSIIAVSYSSVAQYTNFSEVVTFTNGTFQEGGTNITTIDGGNISTNTIKAAQLEISSSSATNSSMFFDGTNNRIDITDSGGNLRVRIGKLN